MLQKLLQVKDIEQENIDGKQLAFQIHDYEKEPYEIDLPEAITHFPRFRKLPEVAK